MAKVVIADCADQLGQSKDALPQLEGSPPVSRWFLDRVVEKNIEKTIASILQWIEDLGNAEFDKSTIKEFFCFRLKEERISVWDFSQLAEKNVYEDPTLWKLIRIRALEIEQAQFPAHQMVYVGSDPFLKRSLNDIEKNISQNITPVKTDCEKLKQPDLLSIAKVVAVSLRILLEEYSWSLLERLRTIFRDTSAAVSENGGPVVSIITYGNSSEIWMDEKNNVESAYWGPLPGLLRRQGYRINWVVINSNLSWSGRTELRKLIKSVSQKNRDRISLIEDSLDLPTIMRLARIFLSLIYRVNKISQESRLQKHFFFGESSTNVFPLLTKTWVFSMVSPRAVRNIIKAVCFSRFFKRADESSFALYMSEGQGWEKGLVNGWRAGQKGKIFGVASPKSVTTEKRTGLPDQIICISKERLRYMSRFGTPDEDLYLAEAVRYIRTAELSRNSSSFQVSEKTIFLVIGDVSRSVNEKMFTMIAAARDAGVLGKTEAVVYKPHPNAEDCTRILRRLELQELVRWSKVELIESLRDFDFDNIRNRDFGNSRDCLSE